MGPEPGNVRFEGSQSPQALRVLRLPIWFEKLPAFLPMTRRAAKQCQRIPRRSNIEFSAQAPNQGVLARFTAAHVVPWGCHYPAVVV